MKRLILLVFVIVTGSVLTQAVSNESAPAPLNRDQERRAVEKVDRTLNNRNRFPWYDAQSRTLRFIPPYVPKNASSPRDDDYHKEKKGNSPLPGILLMWGTIFVLTVVALVLCWAIVKLLSVRKQRRLAQNNDRSNITRRLQTLLPEVREHMDTLLSDAQEAFDSGRFREALIFYFSFMLVELDKSLLIVLEKGKTNHDYARELRGSGNILRIYLRAMNLFERCYYGNRPLDTAEFFPIWNERTIFLEELRKRFDGTVEAGKTFSQKSGNEQVALPGHSNDVSDSNNEENRDSSKQTGNSSGNIARVLLPVFLLLSSCVGCNRYWSDTYTNYIPLYEYDRSINGDTVFRSMCRQAGHTCSMPTRRPKEFDRYDCIVWYYYSYPHASYKTPPRAPLETMDVADVVWLRQWMKKKPGRTLVIVNQGYLADVDYWNELMPLVPSEHRMWCRQKQYGAIEKEFSFCTTAHELAEQWFERLVTDHQSERLLDEAKTKRDKNESSNHETAVMMEQVKKNLSRFVKKESKDRVNGLWFRFENHMNVKSTRTLSGLPYWTDDLPDGPPLRMTRNLLPEDETKVELYTDEYPLICRREVERGNVYVVCSGAFLLNYPLLKERNRILAARLISRLGPKKNIVFLRGRSFIPSAKTEPEISYKVSPFALSRLSAFSLLYWHLFFLVLIVFFWKFPIFGRPKRIPPPETVDFGRHMEAYGELLEQTGNVSWARNQIDKWIRDRSDSVADSDETGTNSE